MCWSGHEWLPEEVACSCLLSCILTAGATNLALACCHSALLTPVKTKKPHSYHPSLPLPKGLVVPIADLVPNIMYYISSASCFQKAQIDRRERSHI